MGLFSKLFNKEDEETDGTTETAEQAEKAPDPGDDAETLRMDKAAIGASVETKRAADPSTSVHRSPPPPRAAPKAGKADQVLMPKTVAKKGTHAERGPGASGGHAARAAAGAAKTAPAARPPQSSGRRPADKPGEQAAATSQDAGLPRRPPSPARYGRTMAGIGNARKAPKTPPARAGAPAAGKPKPVVGARSKPKPPGAAGVVTSATQPKAAPGRAAATGASKPEPDRPALGSPTGDNDDDGAVDAAFDVLQSIPSPGEAVHDSQTPEDTRAVTETFAAVAATHARPLADFMHQLTLGATPNRWATPLRAVVAPLRDAAQRMELEELSTRFEAFDNALAQAAAERSLHISQPVRNELEQAYRAMVASFPETFQACTQDDGRGRVLLEAILLQVPSMQRRTLARLYGAGLQSLEQMIAASAEEMAQVAGIERELAGAIARHLERFNRERSGTEPAALREQIHDQLRGTLEQLEEHQDALDNARDAELTSQKRTARRGLQTSALEVEVLLAQLGELGLIEELKRMPVSRKIARVQSYLDRAAAA